MSFLKLPTKLPAATRNLLGKIHNCLWIVLPKFRQFLISYNYEISHLFNNPFLTMYLVETINSFIKSYLKSTLLNTCFYSSPRNLILLNIFYKYIFLVFDILSFSLNLFFGEQIDNLCASITLYLVFCTCNTVPILFSQFSPIS